jgi:hypothetical protein
MRLWLLLCAATLGIASPAYADPFSINLLSTTHTVTLRSTRWADLSQSSTRTTTGSAPVSDALLVEGIIQGDLEFVEGGTASADPFEVSTWTQTFGRPISDDSLYSIHAYATTALTFMPFASGTALIDVTFLLGSAGDWTESMVRLVDLTTSSRVWASGWGWRDPAVFTLRNTTTTLTTEFDASHLYQLTLFAHSNANGDTQKLTTEVTGLEAVPEPSTLLLVGLGACAAAIKRRRSNRLTRT